MFPVSCDCIDIFKRMFMFDDSFCFSHEAFFLSRPESWSRDPWAVWDWIWCGALVWGVCGQSGFRLLFSGSSLAVLQQQSAAQSARFIPFYSKLCLILCSLMMHFELQQSLLPHTWSVLPYTQLDSVKKKILKAVTKRPVCCRVAVVTVTIVMIVSGCPAASLRLKLQSQFNSMLLCSQ